MTTSPAQRFLHRRLKSEIPMKATLLTPEIAETVLEEKAKKTSKSQMYYNRTAKDLSVLQPGGTVAIKPEGLTKGQQWRKGFIVQKNPFRSYDVEVDGKLLRRNRVHLKPAGNRLIWRRHNLPQNQTQMSETVPRKPNILVQILYLVLNNLNPSPLSLLSPLRRWN